MVLVAALVLVLALSLFVLVLLALLLDVVRSDDTTYLMTTNAITNVNRNVAVVESGI